MRIFKVIVTWLLTPRKRTAEYMTIQDWERIEGIQPRRVKHDWKA